MPPVSPTTSCAACWAWVSVRSGTTTRGSRDGSGGSTGVASAGWVVQGLGAQFAPEQLRKAANEADELVAAIDDLVGAWTAPALDAAGRLGAVGVRHIPDTLRGPDIGARSSELKEVHDRLSRVIGILSEARATVILAEMRVARDQV